jgi:hypothetical protein
MSITTTEHGRIWPACDPVGGFVAAPASSCEDCASVGATLCTPLGESLTFPTLEAAADALAAHAAHGCDFLEPDHAEALAEDMAHDAAMEKAQELTPEVLCRYADHQQGRMPQTLRNRISAARRLSLVPPRRHA